VREMEEKRIKKAEDFDAGRIKPATNVILHGFFILYILICILPIVLVFMISITDNTSLLRYGYRMVPREFSLSAYEHIFRGSRAIINAYLQTIRVTVLGTFFSTAIIALFAWPISRQSFKYRKFFTWMVLVGLFNSRLAVMLPTAMSMFNFMITRTYFASSIPGELLESAKMDGCSDFRFLWSIVIPLSGSIIAVIALFYAVSHWNAFFNAMLYIMDRTKQPLQLVLREILILNQTEQMMEGTTRAEAMYIAEQMKYSLIVLASIPLLAAYPFVQKYFVRGVMVGALKG
jgi:multiple sugar transport system permease protein/putative aldouronate transport system permease protein